jgi:hypothetical protein
MCAETLSKRVAIFCKTELNEMGGVAFPAKKKQKEAHKLHFLQNRIKKRVLAKTPEQTSCRIFWKPEMKPRVRRNAHFPIHFYFAENATTRLLRCQTM